MGTNDFAELGNGRRGRGEGEESFCWHIRRPVKPETSRMGSSSSWSTLYSWNNSYTSRLNSTDETTPPPPAVILVSTPLLLSSSPPVGARTSLALGLHHTLIRHHSTNSPPLLEFLGRPLNPATQISLPLSNYDPSDASPPPSTIFQIAATWSSSILLLTD
ncbi:hypothetical protein BDY24DRAFT_416072 [Mrakia frigida]|uniref:uncharacterized protein n=1 Tax=Mrakia frigida TaxID=29902 RepID=UPI003FCC0AAE